MKRFFSTIVLMVTMLVAAHADTWTIAGAVYKTSDNTEDATLTAQIFGSSWSASAEANDMTLYNGTVYYLVKEITLDNSGDRKVEFKVCQNHSFDQSHGYGFSDNTANGNAWAYLKAPSSGQKTYTLVFTFDSNNTGSLDAVQLVKVIEENDYNTPTDESSWATYLETNEMELDNQGTYRFTKVFTNVAANTNKTFKALTIHRSATYADKGKTNNNVQKAVDKVNGTATTSPYYVNFPSAGNYEVEFEYNLLSNEFNVTTRRYRDVTINVAGNGLGATGLEYGYATFSCDFATEVPQEVRAYYITGISSGKMVSVEVERIPATTSQDWERTGVVLQGSLGTYRFYEYLGDESTSLTNNQLCGTGAGTITIPALISASNYYVLAKVDNVIAFYKANYENLNTTGKNTYPPYKAFYYDGNAHSRDYYTLDFMDDVTSIESMLINSLEKGVSNVTYYNLQGQPVAHPTKGLYIVNGKKLILK